MPIYSTHLTHLYQQQSLRYYFCNFIRKICVGLCFRLFCTKAYTLLPPYFTWAWLLIIWIQPASFTWTRTTTNASYHCWSYMEQSVLWIRHVVYIWYQQSFFTWYEWIYWFLFWYASSVPISKNGNFFLQIVELYRNQTNEWISVMMQVFSEGKLGAYVSHEDICLISTTWSWYYLFIVSHI